MERVVKFDTLEDTCILDVFKERTWTKLLNSSGVGTCASIWWLAARTLAYLMCSKREHGLNC